MSESTELFKKKVGPLLDKCRDKVISTQENYDSVINMEQNYSPAAKCLLCCAMEEVGMIHDGQVTSRDEYLLRYKRAYADVPERLEDASWVVSTCYDEVSEEIFENSCEPAVAMTACTLRLTKEKT